MAAPQEDVTELIKGVVVGDPCREPTFFEKGALHSFFKKLRAAFEVSPGDGDFEHSYNTDYNHTPRQQRQASIQGLPGPDGKEFWYLLLVGA